MIAVPATLLRRARSGAVGPAKLVQVAEWVLALAGSVATVTFVVIALLRLRYPYELEWLESGMLEHVRRVHDGLPLYTPPSSNFVEFGYSPLYMLVGGVLSFPFGIHLSTLRAISLVSTLATFWLLFRLLRAEGASRAVGILGVGLYAACYHRVGGWFDVGKPDSMFLALTAASLLLIRSQRAVWAGVVIALAVLTKQTAVFVVVPVAGYLVVTGWRRAIAYVVPVVGIVGSVTLVWQIASHGWFVYFAWQQLGQQAFINTSKLDFFTKDLWTLGPLALVAAALAGRVRASGRRWGIGLYASAAAGMIAGSWLSRLHQGGFDNVLMPACLAIVLLACVAVGDLLRSSRPWIGVVALGVCALQLWGLQYDVGAQLPSSADRAAGHAFITQVRAISGDVLVASHPTYAVMAGKPSHAQQGGVIDVLRATAKRPKAILERSYAAAIHRKQFAAIVLDDPSDADVFPADWKQFYVEHPGSIFASDGMFRPVTSPTGHPEQLWLRR